MAFTAPASDLETKGFSAPASDLDGSPSGDGGIGDLRKREGTWQIQSAPYDPPSRPSLFSDPSAGGETTVNDLIGPDAVPGLMEQRIKGAKQQAALAASFIPIPGAQALGIGRVVAEGTPWAIRTLKSAKDLAATGAFSGATSRTAERVTGELTGEHKSLPETAKEIGIDAAIGGVAGPAIGAVGSTLVGASNLPVIRGLIPAAKEALTPGPDYFGRIGASYFRRSSTPAQEGLSAARSAIESVTGEKVPISIGEAIGNPAKAHELGIEDKALDTKAMEVVKRSVLFAAAKLNGIKVTASELADETVGLLTSELEKVSAPAKEAIAKVAADLHPAITTANDVAEQMAKNLVPGTGATAEATGKASQSIIRSAFKDISDEVKPLYKAVETHPDYPQVPGLMDKPKEWMDDVIDSSLKTSSGQPIPSSMSESLPPLVKMIHEAGPVQSLDTLRKLRTKVYDSIGNDSIYPGTSNFQKGKLGEALTEEINNAVDSLPTSDLKNKLKAANDLYSEKMDRFKGEPVEQFLRNFGEEGGPTAESLAAKLTKPGGHELFLALQKAAGPRAAEIKKTVGDFLFHNAAESGRGIKTGAVSAGKILENIEGLSPELQKEFFPNLAYVRSLAQRESRIAGLQSATSGIKSSADPLKVLNRLQIDDPALLMDALGPNASADLGAKIADAFKKSADLESQLNGSILGDLKAGDAAGLAEKIAKNPEHWMDGILNGTFGVQQTQKMVDLVSKVDPPLLHKMQFRYVSQLLEKYGGKNIDVSKLSRDLALGADRIGKERQLSRVFLDSKSADDLETVLKGLSTFDEARTHLDPNASLLMAAARATGEAVAMTGAIPGTGTMGGGTLFSSTTRLLQKMRFAVASSILTTPELRSLARTPVSRITPDQWQSIFRATARAAIGTYVSKDSPEAETLNRLSH